MLQLELAESNSAGHTYSECKESLPGEMKMQVKQGVQALLDRLPDDCSLDDVQYHLYVLQSIERGQADAKAGRTISHQEVARELRKKWLVNSAG